MNRQIGQKSIRILIIVLVILLAVSGTALAGTVLYRHFFQSQGSPAVVPDNVISPEKEISASAMPVQAVTLSYRTVNTVKAAPMTVTTLAATPMTVRTVSAKTVVDKAEGEEVTLKLYRNHADDSTPFHVSNMFPGDAETKSYYLEVSYKGNLTIHFRADVRNGYEKLAEVLNCRVSLRDGTQLYNGLMKDMPDSIQYTLPYSSGTTETVMLYLKTISTLVVERFPVLVMIPVSSMASLTVRVTLLAISRLMQLIVIITQVSSTK